MSRLNLIDIAIEILWIKNDIEYKLENKGTKISNYTMETFTQIWGNTSGGFESIGGCAMTTQRTYVFIPESHDGDCMVYFGGRFAYSVPYSETFIKDVKERNIAGCANYHSIYF